MNKSADKAQELEKKIEEAETPEELAEIEKELNSLDSTENSEVGSETTEKPSEDTSITEETTSESQPVTDENVQKELDTLKKQIEDLSKEKDLQAEIDMLKKKIENFNIVDNADLNSSINQSASKLSFIKRALRRLSFGQPIELEIEKRWYDNSTKSFVFELSGIEKNINIAQAKQFGVKLTNPRTKNSILFIFSKEDKDGSGEDTHGWHFIPKGQSYGVKKLLIIND
jgi:hypothetical protein